MWILEKDGQDVDELSCHDCGFPFMHGNIIITKETGKLNLCNPCFYKRFTMEEEDGQEDEESNEEDQKGGIDA